jgi:hypothetical protein
MATRNAPNQARLSTQVADRKIRDRARKPILISSHPEADPELPVPSEASSDPAATDDFRRGPDAERVKPIVSINGSDVDEPEETDCNAA